MFFTSQITIPSRYTLKIHGELNFGVAGPMKLPDKCLYFPGGTAENQNKSRSIQLVPSGDLNPRLPDYNAAEVLTTRKIRK